MLLEIVLTIVFIFTLIGGVFFFTIGCYQTVAHEKTPVESRLDWIQKPRRIKSDIIPDVDVGEGESAPAFVRAQLLPTFTKYLSRSAVIARLDEDLQKARSNWRASEVVVASVMLALIVTIVVMLLIKSAIFALLMGAATLSLPFLYVRHAVRRWLRKFNEQLPDALTLMSNGLKGGYSFLQSLEMVSRESPEPIREQFHRITHEISIGMTVEEAMESFGNRINSMDVDLMVNAVLIQREVGGALAEILDTIADVIRERLRIRREIRTLTAQGRFTGTALALMPVILGFMIYFATAFASGGAPPQELYMYPLLHESVGHKLILGALLLQFLGFLWMRRIVDIEI